MPSSSPRKLSSFPVQKFTRDSLAFWVACVGSWPVATNFHVMCGADFLVPCIASKVGPAQMGPIFCARAVGVFLLIQLEIA